MGRLKTIVENILSLSIDSMKTNVDNILCLSIGCLKTTVETIFCISKGSKETSLKNIFYLHSVWGSMENVFYLFTGGLEESWTISSIYERSVGSWEYVFCLYSCDMGIA